MRDSTFLVYRNLEGLQKQSLLVPFDSVGRRLQIFGNRFWFGVKLIVFMLFNTSIFFAQQKTANKTPKRLIIQFSGVVVETDSLKPVSYASIMIKNQNHGTICDYSGYFSFVAETSDTIVFSGIGYKNGEFIIPDSLSSNKYSLIQVLRKDTIALRETVIYPWPTKEQFKAAFLSLNMPDNDLERATINLAREANKERMDGLPMDGNLNYKNTMQRQYSRLYYAGQYPPNNLLNPVAWAKFIEAWKKGDFKSKD